MSRRAPAAALTRALPSADRIAREIVLAALGRWRHGHVTIRLPDGQLRELGDAAAAERAVVTVVDDAVFGRLLRTGELGAGEAYMEGEWRADGTTGDAKRRDPSDPACGRDLTALLRLFVRNLDALRLDGPLARVGQLASLLRHRLRRNSRAGSRRNVAAHYDLGNDFYRLFLDESMAYSCALWAPDDDLEQAQRRKVDRLLDLCDLRPGDHLLEIGSGWGGLAIQAAATRGCRVTTVTVSRAQHELARARVAAAGLADRVDVRLEDYREITGRYHRIVSVEMLEAVGPEYYPAFFGMCAARLAPGGRMALQTISMPEERFAAYRRNVDWTQKYIFPGAVIPSLGALVAGLRGSGLAIRQLEDIGPHYAPTLREWRRRFLARLPEVRALGFDERFVRMWELYLCFSEAAFTERTLGNLQLVLEVTSSP